MKPIRKMKDAYCRRCGDLATIKIEFENTNVVLCDECEEEFKEEIKEEHL